MTLANAFVVMDNADASSQQYCLGRRRRPVPFSLARVADNPLHSFAQWLSILMNHRCRWLHRLASGQTPEGGRLLRCGRRLEGE